MSTTEHPYAVLIADDDEPTRMLLARIVTLELPGAQVSLAGTCEAALRLANQKSYDVILLDLLMPGMGGFEVLRRLRWDSANRTTPVVVVSALGLDAQSIDLCKSLGADKIVSKPVNRSTLAAAIKAQLLASNERWQRQAHAQDATRPRLH
jgi:DNA-binding response OmpR family regulator